MRGDRQALHLLLPYYVGLLGMAGSSITALGFAIDTPEFIVRAYLLTIVGLTASLIGARIGRNPSLLGAVIASFVFPLLVLANTGAGVTRWFYPDETLGEHSLLLPTLAVWGIVALSFAQVNRPNSIFIFVCALVVFSLTGTINLNASLLISFFAFLLATFFVWSYNGALNLREQAEEAGQAIMPQPGRWAHMHIGVAVALLAVVFVAAVLSGYPTYASTRNFFISPFPARPRALARLPAMQNYAGFSDQFVLLGGPVQLSNELALTVRTSAPALWRGLAYDMYTQHGWRRTIPGADFPLPESPPGSHRQTLWEGNWNMPVTPNVRRIRQEFVVRVRTGDVVISAATPTAVRGATGSPLRAAVDQYGCLHTSSSAWGERSYGVESTAANPAPPELQNAPDRYPDLIERYYLPVPPGTRAELQQLADRITAGCRTPYDKVMAVENHLDDECRYTLDVPPIPFRQDAVAYFLKTTKRGACDLFSSSLVVLLRLSGVPARVVTGYATGEQDEATGLYHVTNADAHAWAEVYFPRVGWVEFDPPYQREPDRLSWLRKLFQPGWTGPALRVIGKRAGVALILLVLINALILAVSGASPVQLGAGWLRRRRSAANPRQQVALAYLLLCSRLARLASARGGWQTPTDYALQVGACEKLPAEIRQDELPQLTDEFLRLRYSPSPPSSEQASAFTRQAQDLARGIRTARRTPRPS